MDLLDFFVTSAYAADVPPSPPPPGGGLSFAMMFVIFIIFVYFLILRPQNKRAREQQNLLNSIAKGDEVLTAGGLLGRIVKITDQYIILSPATNLELVMQKSSVVSILPKGTLKTIE
jgi:preprotein translocase subunit YajC